MSETEFDEKVATMKAALQTLCRDQEAMPQLDALCQFMADCELPHSARLFILNHGVLTIGEVDTNDRVLIEAAESGTKLDFSIRCIKEFVQRCKDGSHDYDYPPSGSSRHLPSVNEEETSSTNSQKPRQRSHRMHEQDRSSVFESASSDKLSAHNNHSQLSSDTGYSESYSLPPQLQQQPPIPKPRSQSVSSQGSSNTLPAGASARMGHKPSDPELQIFHRSGSRSGKNRFIQLLLFPENAKKSAHHGKKRTQSST